MPISIYCHCRKMLSFNVWMYQFRPSRNVSISLIHIILSTYLKYFISCSCHVKQPYKSSASSLPYKHHKANCKRLVQFRRDNIFLLLIPMWHYQNYFLLEETERKDILIHITFYEGNIWSTASISFMRCTNTFTSGCGMRRTKLCAYGLDKLALLSLA